MLRMFNMQDADRVYSNPGDGRSNYPNTGDTYKVWFATNDTTANDNRIRINYNWEDTSTYNDVRINFDSQEVYLFEVGGNGEQDYDNNLGFENDERYLLEIQMEEDSHTVTIYDSSGSQVTELSSNTNPHSEHSGIAFRSWRQSNGAAQYILGAQVDNTIN